MHDFAMVFFDLETTGLDTRRCHIIQLGAVCGHLTFNAYIVPQRPITQRAYEVNGFYMVDGILYRRRKAKPTVSVNRALTSFLRFLRSLDRPVCLAAHNANSFHVRILMRLLWRFHHFWKFRNVVHFHLDTLKVSRMINPGGSQKLKDLVGKDYDAHNGLEDARALQGLWKRWALNDHDIQDFLIEW
ncbi:uncharacterized protein LOC109518178 [Hippocampus comes]|uniref:uncharacterized protein LOC109518178 n=1 Tax=Hippocampus comes TaxID=109280 RepID=UPI00094EC0F4|nr:PREDICTED: uncharacterized protein LOC109518178 [Hippocampus comes]XP_019729430.1 PREDICTED: uncharacterized protein LOC109518178 [Hippocampus comes]XP_019729431.1 PREDICTED: uncharacterized protein LOC109518178 [Hippocampus comes]